MARKGKTFIVQGVSPMIPEDGIPVLNIKVEADFTSNWREAITKAVNFLRCGCPSVQMLYSYVLDESTMEGGSKQRVERVNREAGRLNQGFEDLLRHLSAQEKFEVGYHFFLAECGRGIIEEASIVFDLRREDLRCKTQPAR